MQWLSLVWHWNLQEQCRISDQCMLKRHTVASNLSAVYSFPAPNERTSNVPPNMSLLCCEKSFLSYRPYCVGWRKYLNCSYAITRSRHTGIHLLYYYIPDFAIWCVGSKVKATYEILFLFIVNTIQAELLKRILTIGGTYTPFCIRMASLFFKVRVQSSSSHVRHGCSF